MPGAKQRSVHHLCRPNKIIWQREQKRTLKNSWRPRLSTKVYRPFKITNGVKQGCLLAPTVFTLFFTMILQHVTEDLDDEDGVYIRFRIDVSLFNVSPHKDQRETDRGAPVRWWCCPCCPYWLDHVKNNILLRGSRSALRTWRTSEEDWSSPSACATRGVPSTRHSHRTARTESSPPVQRLRMRYHIWLPT